MKKLSSLCLVTLAVLALATTAFAQPEDRDLGIYFDDGMGGRATSRDIPAFQPVVNAMVVGQNLGPTAGWEANLGISDAAWNFSVSLVPAASLNAGQVPNYIVGFGACIDSPGEHLLATIGLGYYSGSPSPADVLICAGPASPSSFGGMTPGYSSCDDVLIPFGMALNGEGRYPNGCAVLNASEDPPVPNEATSWGSMKADF